MNKINMLGYIIILIGAIGIFFAGTLFGIDANYSKTKVMNELNFIDMLGQKFAENHNYTINEYNCINYSRDFMFVANSLGYNSTMIGGIQEENSTSGHLWNQLTIELEPQSNKWGYISDTYYKMRSNEYLNKYG